MSASHLFLQVEKSIAALDEVFVVSGRVILVNCYGAPNTMGLTCHAATSLREKYCLQLLSANVYVCISDLSI